MGAFGVALLIVPYGIETRDRQHERMVLRLLIVPYGIETFFVVSITVQVSLLLIVPYGIETTKQTVRHLPL